MANTSGMPRVMEILRNMFPWLKVQTGTDSPGFTFVGIWQRDEEIVQIWLGFMALVIKVVNPDRVTLNWIRKPDRFEEPDLIAENLELEALGDTLAAMQLRIVTNFKAMLGRLLGPVCMIRFLRQHDGITVSQFLQRHSLEADDALLGEVLMQLERGNWD